MKIGIVGAGIVAKAIGKALVKANHELMFCNSRGPKTLFSLAAYFPCKVGTVEQVIVFGDVIILAIPFEAHVQLDKNLFNNKILIDTTNYYPDRDGDYPNLNDRTLTSSETIAHFLENDHLVKAFNSIKMKDFEQLSFPSDPLAKIALPIAGNYAFDKQMTSILLSDLGFDIVDVGDLKEGWRFERGMPIYCALLSQDQLKQEIERAVKIPV